MKTITKIIELLKDQSLNTNTEALIVEKLKTFKGCETLTEEELSEKVVAVQIFAYVLYELIYEQSAQGKEEEAILWLFTLCESFTQDIPLSGKKMVKELEAS
jgi:hypothetical protein